MKPDEEPWGPEAATARDLEDELDQAVEAQASPSLELTFHHQEEDDEGKDDEGKDDEGKDDEEVVSRKSQDVDEPAEAESDGPDPGGRYRTGLAERVRKRGWRILLVEDDDDYALLVERALEKVTGNRVKMRRGRTGIEGLALLREQVPDLVILDLKMPEMAGHEALDVIKGDETLRSIPVAILSSSDRDDDVAKSYGLGGNHYITKPRNPVELEAKLASLLRNLGDLRGVRRGSEGVATTAASAVSPDSMFTQSVLRWGLVVGALIVLYVYGKISGAF